MEKKNEKMKGKEGEASQNSICCFKWYKAKVEINIKVSISNPPPGKYISKYFMAGHWESTVPT